MARIIVTADDRPDDPLLDERHIGAVHLESQQSAIQLLERLEWAIREANVHAQRRRRSGRRRRRPPGRAPLRT